MPTFERDGVSLYYEDQGQGYPILLIAPGGMRSCIPMWTRGPWDPMAELHSDFRLIAMDQRNAGRSSAPVRPGDSWDVYAADQVALLDHLGIERCHALGGCIGGAYCLNLIRCAPTRVTAAVLQQPIGLSEDNRSVFYELFDSWAAEVSARQPDVKSAVWKDFREAMYGGDFVFSVTREFVKSCRTPLLVLMGADVYHPTEVSREIVELAPEAALIESWKEPDSVGEAVSRVREFLRRHTPEYAAADASIGF